MRKHLFLGRGRCILKKDIQHSMHSGKGIRITHGLMGRSEDGVLKSLGSGSKKKLSPLKFKF